MADVEELARQVQKLQGQLADEANRSKRLIEVSTQLNSTLNLSELLNSIINTGAELLDAETGSLLLLDEETGELTFEVATGEPGEQVVKRRVPLGQGIAGWVLQHGEPLIVQDPATDPRFYAQIDKASGFQTRNILALPLKIKDRVIGVVEIINTRGEAGFDRADQGLAEALASQAAVAIDNARMYARLTDAVVAARMSSRMYQLGVE